jgi:hypothetical protein
MGGKRFTPEEDAIIARMLVEGSSAGMIGKVIDRSKNSVIGHVRDVPRLKAIGFKGKFGGPVAARTKRKTEQEVREKRQQYGRPVSTMPPAPTPKPVLKVIANTSMMIADWLKKNGGPRRFERGFSTDYSHLRFYLEKHGVTLSLVKSRCYLSTGGSRPRKVEWEDVYRIADKFRRAGGLEPILRASA